MTFELGLVLAIIAIAGISCYVACRNERKRQEALKESEAKDGQR